MLKLTPINQVSTDHVRYVAPASIGMIELRLGGGSDVMMFGRMWSVQETPEEIMAMPEMVKYLNPLVTVIPEELEQAEAVCAVAYQAVGCMLSELGQFDSKKGQNLLTNLSEARMVHSDILPWPSFKADRER